MSNTKNFTTRLLDSLTTNKDREILHDTQVQGLSLKVSNVGNKTFFVRKRMEGVTKQLYFTIGKYPSTTIGQARQQAREKIVLAQSGVNPTLIKSDNVTRKTLTLKKVFEDYQRSRGATKVLLIISLVIGNKLH